ncbi:MAG TPA: ribosomal protein S18-alanine N-acetyltransferase [Candidatus Acidoferrales bacterium]|nr:ribosomal protein S18-alanine N-acetyltransferase [Candidatus Acidoferrales bacterium]
MNKLTIRAFHPRDTPAILEIQHLNREAAQWQQIAYEGLEKTGEKAWVAEQNGAIAGFLVARAITDEMEVLNLAVRPNAHRQGIGRELLQHAISWSAERRVHRVFLEVRASNTVAQNFYEANGFAQTGIRPNYYSDPVEAALLLAKSVDRK